MLIILFKIHLECYVPSWLLLECTKLSYLNHMLTWSKLIINLSIGLMHGFANFP
jgi:hypothetical protein